MYTQLLDHLLGQGLINGTLWGRAAMERWKRLRLDRRRRDRIARRSNWRRRLRYLRQQRLDGLAERLPQRVRRSDGRKYRPIKAPPHLNLQDAFSETVDFLSLVRQTSTSILGKFYVDFTTVETLTPAAALLVVAEFDRWRELVKSRSLRPIDLDQWKPEVYNILYEMGFFDLLSTGKVKVPMPSHPVNVDERYLSFVSGHEAEGNKAKQLRLGIEALGPKLRQRNLLFQGLTEAMTNVKHHAYNVGDHVKRWWMSASVDTTGRRLRIMFLDHGLSIPVVLPRRKMERLRAVAEFILPLPQLLKSDASLIQAAVELNRSGTGQDHRGFGLNRDIQGYIENLDARGKLRILSGRGQYVYEKSPGQSGSASTKALPAKFGGTFIEWIIEDYAAGDKDDQ
ncbi:anti-sigma regulatory factor (Ser/Thr protein kinase) [Dyella sp. SG562]|uniref:hypothetical protein n=1 Tax=Dyella sp. SG562 TaxID=2587017 RepID=UPI00141F9B7B|nr:hypothetical protein [Dyella sp. SG562]NII75174.1 anti-sigma regulatory factor (Ser/Thr protein kinase) [Dyella sp. SG562]